MTIETTFTIRTGRTELQTTDAQTAMRERRDGATVNASTGER